MEFLVKFIMLYTLQSEETSVALANVSGFLRKPDKAARGQHQGTRHPF